jgi:hypothetical protein
MLFTLLVLPAVVAGGLLSLQSQALNPETGPRTTGGALNRSIEAGETTTRTLASGHSSAKIPNPCAKQVPFRSGTRSAVSAAFHEIRDKDHKVVGTSRDIVLFPFVPDGISGWDANGNRVETLTADQRNAVCQPGFWTREVFYWFGYKVLAILNWLAMAAAIILTIYGGLLYISSYANEANAKKAKGIIVGAFIGLAIIFLAKVLVYGAVNIISGQDPSDIAPPVEIDDA